MKYDFENESNSMSLSSNMQNTVLILNGILCEKLSHFMHTKHWNQLKSLYTHVNIMQIILLFLYTFYLFFFFLFFIWKILITTFYDKKNTLWVHLLFTEIILCWICSFFELVFLYCVDKTCWLYQSPSTIDARMSAYNPVLRWKLHPLKWKLIHVHQSVIRSGGAFYIWKCECVTVIAFVVCLFFFFLSKLKSACAKLSLLFQMLKVIAMQSIFSYVDWISIH